MRLQSFRGLRYDDPTADPSISGGVMDLSSVVHVDGDDPVGYSAGRLLHEPALVSEWLRSGILALDDEPSLYIYRSGSVRDGESVQSSGVIGAIGQATQEVCVDVSFIEIRSSELSGLIESVAGRPLARATDRHGVHHRLWSVAQPSFVDAVNASVESGLSPMGGSSTLVALGSNGSAPPLGLVMRGHPENRPAGL